MFCMLFYRRPFVAKKLYVGNLPHGVDSNELQGLFEAYGTVLSAQVITDRETGRSKGFGFVEMGTEQEAQAGIKAMNGKELDGRVIKVNEARPRNDRGGPSRGGERRNFYSGAGKRY